MIRVGLTGASGTGKSTLAKYIADTLNIPENPVGSRSVAAEMGLDYPYQADELGVRQEFQKRLLISKIEWEFAHEQFVTDRLPLDNLLYEMLHSISTVESSTLDLVRHGLSRYTHIIYCPVSTFRSAEEDKARLSSEAYHEVYDAALQGLLYRYANNVMRLNEVSIQARQEAVLRFLKG